MVARQKRRGWIDLTSAKILAQHHLLTCISVNGTQLPRIIIRIELVLIHGIVLAVIDLHCVGQVLFLKLLNFFPFLRINAGLLDHDRHSPKLDNITSSNNAAPFNFFGFLIHTSSESTNLIVGRSEDVRLLAQVFELLGNEVVLKFYLGRKIHVQVADLVDLVHVCVLDH